MKFINPSIEYWPQQSGIEGIWHQIARATKVSYQSQGRVGESDEDFVKRVVLKPAIIKGDLDDLENCEFNFDKMHGSCLEQCTVYLHFPVNDISNCKSAYSQHSALTSSFSGIYVTTNMRVLFELNSLGELDYLCEPTEHHPRRYTFSVTTDIATTREMNRHRSFSIIEESTRYCAYDKDKFSNQLTYTRPAWVSEDSTIWNAYGENNSPSDITQECKAILDGNKDWEADDYYIFALKAAEYAYLKMRKLNVPAERCRQVLNLNTKTQAVYTAFDSDWQHFLRLRSDGVSGRPHPNIKLIADKIKQIAKEQNLW